jgi:hypothetical protein
MLWKIGLVLICICICCLILCCLPLLGREKDAVQYGMGLIVNIPFPEAEVSQVVADITQNGIIRGTKEYNKDDYVADATGANSTHVFPAWTGGGKVFYKVRLHALDPRNFKNGGDVGTLAVRYVVQPQGDKNTILRIDALFVEDFRRVSHASNGSVESAEYKDIHDRLDAIDLMKAQTVEAEREKREHFAKMETPASTDAGPAAVPESVPANSANADVSRGGEASSSSSSSTSSSTEAASTPTSSAESSSTQASSAQSLEQHVRDLRRQVQRLVKAPGAPLQSAPFHTATTLQSLPTGTEVLIVITTPYWFGVETHEGQHGWILRDELEQVP